jgi:hypothetical protein
MLGPHTVIVWFPSQGDVIKITKEVNNKPMEISGSYADIWHALERTLNFT